MMQTLIVFAREPIPGRTKTRLCPLLDNTCAAELYASFLRDVLDLARQITGVPTLVAYTPESDGAYFTRLAPDLMAIPQRGDSLGERMDHALADSLNDKATAVVLIGSDSPNLPVWHLYDAFERLERVADVVLGPTDDGGYYLIGLRSRQPRLLREVRMSTPTVLADTLALAYELGLRIEQLAPWYDVDTGADVRRLAGDLRGAPADIAPHTRKMLANLFPDR